LNVTDKDEGELANILISGYNPGVMFQANFSKYDSNVAYRQKKGLKRLSRETGVNTTKEKRYLIAKTR